MYSCTYICTYEVTGFICHDHDDICMIADEDLWVETFYSKDLMLLLLNKFHISYVHTYMTVFMDKMEF